MRSGPKFIGNGDANVKRLCIFAQSMCSGAHNIVNVIIHRVFEMCLFAPFILCSCAIQRNNFSECLALWVEFQKSIRPVFSPYSQDISCQKYLDFVEKCLKNLARRLDQNRKMAERVKFSGLPLAL
jgi:hypothetical protein